MCDGSESNTEINHVIFKNDTVIKKGDPARMRVEVEKSRRAFQIGRECGLFRVPNVLDYNDYTGVAVFERIDGLMPIYSAIPWGKEYSAFAEILGSSVAIIHEKLILPENMIVPLPPQLLFPGCDVFIHGDLSVSNICVEKRWPPIVLLDWQMTAFHGGEATFGTRYFDLMWFIDNLLYRPKFRFLIGNPVTTVARIFLEAYFKTARIEYMADNIRSYASIFFKFKRPFRRKQMSGREIVLLLRSHGMEKEFMESLSLI